MLSPSGYVQDVIRYSCFYLYNIILFGKNKYLRKKYIQRIRTVSATDLYEQKNNRIDYERSSIGVDYSLFYAVSLTKIANLNYPLLRCLFPAYNKIFRLQLKRPI